MYKVFWSIASIVVVLNMYLLFVPDGKYEKYTGFVAGLLILLISAQNFLNRETDISFPQLDFNSDLSFKTTEVSRLALEQWIEGIAEGNLSSAVRVHVKKQGEEIRSVELYSASPLREEEIIWLSEQCDINREKFVIK